MNIEEKIAEIINDHCIEYQRCHDKDCTCNQVHGDDYIEDRLAVKILSLIQIELRCNECEYKGICEDDPQKSDYCPKRIL